MAELIPWKTVYELGIAEIDAQHRVLVQFINELHVAMLERKSQQVMGEVLDGLLEYTRTHFSTEEQYFEQSGFSQAVAHKEIHRAFTAKVEAFRADFAAQKAMLSMAIMGFLKDWLIEHIMGVDRKYVEAFKSAGIQ